MKKDIIVTSDARIIQNGFVVSQGLSKTEANKLGLVLGKATCSEVRFQSSRNTSNHRVGQFYDSTSYGRDPKNIKG